MSIRSDNNLRATSIPPVNLHSKEVGFYDAYTKLAISGRREVERLLLRHAVLSDGFNLYERWGDFARISTRKLLLDRTSEEMADAWYYWAFEISLKRMSRMARREAIVRMVTHFDNFSLFEHRAKKPLQRKGKIHRTRGKRTGPAN